MATVSIEVQVQEQVREIVALLMKRPITEEIAMRIGSIDGFKHLEIRNGQWVGFEQDEYMTGEEHGWIETKLLLFIGNYIVAHNLGRIYPGDMDFVLSGNGDDVKDKLQPDVAFVTKERVQKTPGLFYGAPDLAIEIVSPTQFRPEMTRKADEYLLHGTKQVWLVFPKKNEIEVYSPVRAPIVYTESDILPGGDLLPGFTLDVAKVFSE